MSLPKIFVTGATGMVGRKLVPALLQAGFTVRCLVRKTSLGKLPINQLVEVCQAETAQELERSMQGCHVLVNLAGIIREFPQQKITFQATHIQFLKNLITAARQCGIKNIVQVSAQGADAGETNQYLSSKYQAECLLKQSGLPYTILRPTFLYDKGGIAFEMFLRQVRYWPFVPVIGEGDYRQQPLYVVDFVDALLKILSDPDKDSSSYDVGGAEQFTYKAMLDQIGLALGKSVYKIRFPASWAVTLSALLGQFPFYPLDATMLDLLFDDDICDAAPFWKRCGLVPRSFQDGLRLVLTDD